MGCVEMASDEDDLLADDGHASSVGSEFEGDDDEGGAAKSSEGLVSEDAPLTEINLEPVPEQGRLSSIRIRT